MSHQISDATAAISTSKQRSDGFIWGARVISTVTILLVVVPLALMVWKLFLPDGRFNLSAFGDLLSQPWLGKMLGDTLIVVASGVVSSMVVGSVFAWLTERTNARIGWLSRLLPLLPLFMPPLASAIGWVLLATPGPGVLNVWSRELGALFGMDVAPNGPFNVFTWTGVILLYMVALVPQVYLVVAAALRNVEPSIEEASRVSGVGPLRTLVKVTLPAIRPSLISAALLAMASAFSLFSVPFLIGTTAGVDNLIVRVVRITTDEFPARTDVASALGLIVVFFIGGSWLLQRRVNRLARHARLEGKTSSASTIDLGWFRWPARIILIAYIAATSLLPLYGLVSVALQSFWSGEITPKNFTLKNFAAIFDPSKNLFNSLANSLVLGVLTALVAMFVAMVVGYYGERRPRSWLARIADGVIKLPAALSHVIVALALIIAFVGPPFRLQGTLILLFIGYFVLYLPQASVSANAALSQLGPILTEASLVSGAGEMRTFFRIVLPLMGPGMVAGWVMVFVLAAGDLTASVMLASPRSPVVGFVMLDLSTSGTYGSVAALGVVITLLNAVVGGAVTGIGQTLGKRTVAPSRRLLQIQRSA